ncbi:MAG: Mini-ribonuclease 3 [Clostridiales bacterium]|nr:Mini-ribonuclease 3 [Clostridiales bacterium]
MPGSLELAYVGDSVYDLYVRTRLVRVGGRMKPIHRSAVSRVCCAAQSQALSRVEPLLDDEEMGVVRRARNHKQTPPRGADPADYHRATALEALIGYLYLTGRTQRMEQILASALDDGEEGGN